MADGDGAATRVDDVGVDLPGVQAGQRLHRERLVEFDGPDLGPADAGGLQCTIGRLDRSVPEVLGGQRVAPLPAIRATGSIPITDAARSDPMRTADAPSLRGEALPAVIVPFGRKDGFSCARASGVEPGRMLSSRDISDPGTDTTNSS